MRYHLLKFRVLCWSLFTAIIVSSCSSDCTDCPLCSIEEMYGTWYQGIDLDNGRPASIYYTFSATGIEVSSNETEIIPGVVFGAEPGINTKPPIYQDQECRLIWVQMDYNSQIITRIWTIEDYDDQTITISITNSGKEVIIENLQLTRLD